jgi:hypothetical protein
VILWGCSIAMGSLWPWIMRQAGSHTAEVGIATMALWGLLFIVAGVLGGYNGSWFLTLIGAVGVFASAVITFVAVSGKAGPIGCAPFAVSLAAAAHPIAQRISQRRAVCGGRCKNCGYDLTGNVTGQCPECGTIHSKRLWKRTRYTRIGRGRSE